MRRSMPWWGEITGALVHNDLRRCQIRARYFRMNPICPGPSTGLELGSGWAWGSLVLPYLEQRPLYDAANFDLSFGEVHEVQGLPDHFGLFENGTVRRASVSTFLCPSAGGGGRPIDLGAGDARRHRCRPLHRIGRLDGLFPGTDPRDRGPLPEQPGRHRRRQRRDRADFDDRRAFAESRRYRLGGRLGEPRGSGSPLHQGELARPVMRGTRIPAHGPDGPLVRHHQRKHPRRRYPESSGGGSRRLLEPPPGRLPVPSLRRLGPVHERDAGPAGLPGAGHAGRRGSRLPTRTDPEEPGGVPGREPSRRPAGPRGRHPAYSSRPSPLARLRSNIRPKKRIDRVR